MQRLSLFTLLLAASACASSTVKAKRASGPSTNSAVPSKSNEGEVRHAESAEPAESIAGAQDPVVALAEARTAWDRAEVATNNLELWQRAYASLANAAALHKGQPREAEILRSALAAWHKVRLSDRSTRPAVAADSHRRDSRTLTILARLSELLAKDDPEQIRISYQVAQLHYRGGNVDKAIPIFVHIIENAPEQEESGFAAMLLLDALGQQGKKEETEQHVKTMLGNKALLDKRDELKETLLQIRHRAHMERARALVDAGDYETCGAAFMAIYARDKKLGFVNADEVLHNAGICFERSTQTAKAIKIWRQLAREFPQSPLAKIATERAKALGK